MIEVRDFDLEARDHGIEVLNGTAVWKNPLLFVHDGLCYFILIAYF